MVIPTLQLPLTTDTRCHSGKQIFICRIHTNGLVVNHCAKCVLIPRAFGMTRVPTHPMHTCHIVRAVMILETFGCAGRRDPIVPWETMADSPGSRYVARSHGTTRAWVAGGDSFLVHQTVGPCMSDGGCSIHLLR